MSNRQVSAADTRRRIIESAACLFSQGGYNGTGTRDIAQGANINEATIFRHFSHKRDLYLAVLESELKKVRLRGDLLAEVADAPNARDALANTYTLITSALIAACFDYCSLVRWNWEKISIPSCVSISANWSKCWLDICNPGSTMASCSAPMPRFLC